ncbi:MULTISPECIES: hypothetical protein [unclassified Chitinophaga]|uniref:hypothetical protein n=1 Tax=unclassified Chitinophaga TaxID=2619133 RepID=UPI00117C2109|nr:MULTISPECIES: hypothetical protein [unclassified Chitinophaga]WPV66029.1 hypothetical protein QQL36_29965 [Chitinophaga sp. LS1]
MAKLAIMIANSPQNLSEREINFHSQYQNIEISHMIYDTIKIRQNELELVSEDKYEIEIKIISPEKLRILTDSKKPILVLVLKNRQYVAKANHIASSSVPNSCDWFYPVNAAGRIFLSDNNIRFMKIDALNIPY